MEDHAGVDRRRLGPIEVEAGDLGAGLGLGKRHRHGADFVSRRGLPFGRRSTVHDGNGELAWLKLRLGLDRAALGDIANDSVLRRDLAVRNGQGSNHGQTIDRHIRLGADMHRD